MMILLLSPPKTLFDFLRPLYSVAYMAFLGRPLGMFSVYSLGGLEGSHV